MCDGFDPGTIHWQIRNDEVLDLGVQGPRAIDAEIRGLHSEGNPEPDLRNP